MTKVVVLWIGSVGLAGCAALEAGEKAQPAERTAAEAAPTQPARRLVTGSRIRRAGGPDSGPSRVKVITREELAATGEADLSRALDKVTVP